MKPKSIIAVMLCGTVCTVLLTFIISTAFYPPNSISETSRVKTFELLIYILGIVSGYLLGKGGDETQTPDPRPQTPPAPDPRPKTPDPNPPTPPAVKP